MRTRAHAWPPLLALAAVLAVCAGEDGAELPADATIAAALTTITANPCDSTLTARVCSRARWTSPTKSTTASGW